jgi:parallel beta-helix repeat protein
MKRKVAKNFWGVAVSLLFGVLATARAHDASEQVVLLDATPILFRGDLSPANAAYPITRSGIYKLTTAKAASGVPNISITANNVTLDLGGNTLTGGTNGIEVSGNYVTVKNGTVAGMTQNGMLVQGSGCRIENCDMVSSITGITLQNSNQCLIENCRVRNMTQAGVSLVASYTNYVYGCSVTGVYSAGDVYGFISANGGSNVFDSCSVKNVGTTGEAVTPVYATVGLQSAIGGGIVFKESENNSQVLNSRCLSIEQTTTVITQSFGIGLLPGQVAGSDSLLSVTSASASDSFFSMAWLTVAGKYYAAVGGSGLEELHIYEFDPQTESLLTVTKNSDPDGQVFSLAWLVEGDKNFLAAGGDGTNMLRIFDFDAATNSLISITQNQIEVGIRVYATAWLNIEDKNYLAVGGDGTNDVHIFKFDSATESLLTVTQNSDAQGDVNTVAWLVVGDKKYLAVGGEALPPDESKVRIFEFNDATNSLVTVTHSPYVESTVYTVSWLVAGDKKYLAAATPDFETNALSIFEFNDSTSSLYSVTNSSLVGGQLFSTAWLVSGDKNYLATGGNQLSIGTFNEETQELFTVTQMSLASDNLSLGWLQVGGKKYIGNALYSPAEFSVFEFQGAEQQLPQQCLLTNNNVSGVHSFRNDLAIVGDVANGIGLSISTTLNYVASNVAYDCDSAFAGVPMQFITSQANTRGVYNIDTNLTTPDTVSLIVDQVSTIESKIDVLYQDSFTVESKLDYLTACDYDPLPAPTTLSTDYAAYCLSADMAGDLAITGSGITLCLNGHTITGGTNGILVSGDEVVLKNGTVRNASASGIKITGDKCTLQDITAVGNVTGFELNGADNGNVSSCRAIENTREGFLLTNAQKNNFEQCEAITTSGAGLVSGIKTTGGTGNNFVDCTVNGVTSSAGEAYGLLVSNEQKTSIARCAVNSVSGQNYTAGVALIGDYLGTPTANDFTYAESRNSRFPEWLNTPVGSYLAISNEASPLNARIFQFSPTDGLLSVTTTQNMTSGCRQATWLSWHNKQYLAMVGDNDAGNDIFVYEFNLATNTLTTINSYAYSATTGVFGCDWLVSGTLAYLAYVVYPNFASAEELGVLRFDGSSLVKVSSLEYLSTGLLSVKHHVYNGNMRLVVTQHPPTGRPDLIIHSFNEPQGSEALTTSTLGLASYDLTGAEYIEKCGWFDFDGQTYLTFGVVGAVSTSNVRVLRYTENPTPTISAFASFNYGGVVQDVDALVTGTTVYLAVGGGVSGQITKILTFDPYAATADRIKSYYDCSADASQTNGVSWNRCSALDNKIFLGVTKASANPRVYGFTLNSQSQLNLVSDTIISDVKSVSNGSGLLADTVINSVTDNRVYNCDDGLVEGIRTQYPGASFDTSNWYLPG